MTLLAFGVSGCRASNPAFQPESDGATADLPQNAPESEPSDAAPDLPPDVAGSEPPDTAPDLAPDAAAQPPPDLAPDSSLAVGLVGHWSFDEGMGTAAADRSGGNQ